MKLKIENVTCRSTFFLIGRANVIPIDVLRVIQNVYASVGYMPKSFCKTEKLQLKIQGGVIIVVYL